MVADHAQVAAGARQHPRHELAQLAVAHDQRAHARADGHLLRDLERGREGLGERRDLVRDAVGHREQVAHRQRQPLGHGTVARHDAEHRAALAVGAAARPAGVALPAPRVDLADQGAHSDRNAPSQRRRALTRRVVRGLVAVSGG